MQICCVVAEIFLILIFDLLLGKKNRPEHSCTPVRKINQ